MKIGVIISSNDAETCWNALLMQISALGKKMKIKFFLQARFFSDSDLKQEG